MVPVPTGHRRRAAAAFAGLHRLRQSGVTVIRSLWIGVVAVFPDRHSIGVLVVVVAVAVLIDAVVPGLRG